MRENRDPAAALALADFTARYVEYWRQTTGGLPVSHGVSDIPSPCVVGGDGDAVYWQPRPVAPDQTLAGVERALALRLQPAAQAYYCSQYAGDMPAAFEGEPLELVQVWSESDFVRVQENLIGHLLMQQRLRQTPTLFIGTTASELTIISLCNLSGQVLREQVGGKRREVLAADLAGFLTRLAPRLPG
ncbi:SecY-interacting protein [Sodalis endosymbiont of Spalangia cameroni]|uniref:SecY-interacting protein n=1 Tax=Sodalis praecaptivus TaxID=1239307 RepID=UPI0031F819C5